MTSRGVVVIGASAAGVAAVEGLRRLGYGDRIVLVGDEPHLPYDRPPLSKQLLSGEWDRDKVQLRTAAAYEELDVELRLGTAAGSLDVAGHRVGLADGTVLGYDHVVVATGVRARTLPGTEGIEGVHVLRTLDDALALTAELAARPRLVIVGGGFIGAEAAAVASGLGCAVVMVTDQRVPLADAVGADIGGMLTEAHRGHDVRMETEALVEAVVSDGSRATGVKLADGRILRADAVLIGIGARPNVEWLKGSGLAVGNGVLCDATLCAAPDRLGGGRCGFLA
ncbi:MULTISPECIES: NAD(P)/FAD-dependent oxidoreductase [Streptomyces]|uniref:NAD(P)/FAD-dependent oxidoreductase n=1 Tax=Streptomyces salyersiae TaxID=3075530 RepID=A0ABU2RCG9_9ACTN|nr:NAD(P)/FAD-dependent oxidoreductase [Streptomyces sp. DSM 41770]MDT0426566.1 NAD(P)/FAD-dependent oxidoreductase [Streptomyces sp. DSM 41770]